MVDIADFVPHAPLDPEVITEYRDRVPAELMEIWEGYGLGSFADGFLRIIDPRLYEAEISDCIGKTQGDGVAIPIMVTGLGDVITWEPSMNAAVALLYREGRAVGLGTLKTFFTLTTAGGATYLSRTFNWDVFPDAVAEHGDLPYDESFIFVPLLSLGGEAKVENLHKRQTLTAIQMTVDLQGVIGH